MAKITITFEDKPEGGVRVVSDPTFETMMKMNNSGHALTSAHGYALAAINKILELSKRQNAGNSLLINIPKVKRF